MSRDQLQRFFSAMTIFKGQKGKESQLIIKVGGQILHHFSIVCRLLASLDLPLDAVLPVWSTCKFAKGETRGRESVIL